VCKLGARLSNHLNQHEDIEDKYRRYLTEEMPNLYLNEFTNGKTLRKAFVTMVLMWAHDR
jgi:hypothetical protein